MTPTRIMKSIRFRLTLFYSAILSAVLIGFSLALVGVFNYSLQGQYAQQLRSYAEQIGRDAVQLQFKLDPGSLRTFASSGAGRTPAAQQHLFDITVNSNGDKITHVAIPFQISSKDGTLLFQSSRSDSVLQSAQAKSAKATAAANGTTTGAEFSMNGQPFGVVAVPVHSGKETLGVVTVADNISHIQDTVDQVFFYMKVAIPLVLLLAAALGWFLAGRALAPVEKIRRLASEISVSDLSRRLHIEGDDELAQLAATFDSMIDRLEKAFVRQKQFTSDASHELRTPLAVMQADFSLARRRRRSVPEYENVLDSAQEEIARMSAIVDSLAMLARMDNSKMVLDLRDVRLDALLADLVARMDVLAADQAITLSVRDLTPMTVQADERLLKQLVLNLLNNAIAYTPPHGRIEVRLIPLSRSEVAFHVRDTGIGIPAAALPHIFERFYRVDASRQRHPGGSGLGLAICQSIATAHGGSIGVYSVEGHSTTFTVVLPVGGPAAELLPAPRSADELPVRVAETPVLTGAAHQAGAGLRYT